MKNRLELDTDLIDELFRVAPEKIKIEHPRRKGPAIEVKADWKAAFEPPLPKLPKDFVRLGGIPVKKTPRGPEFPDIIQLRNLGRLLPWRIPDWHLWFELTDNDCKFVTQKASRVEIPVLGPTRMCQVSRDCARVFTVTESGYGCVVNVVTESVEGGFNVTPDPGASYPVDLPDAPVVNPFTKGGINHKYQRLYVPASFYDEFRTGERGGFYVAVIDIDPTSSQYLNTIDYVDCGWVPEEVSFTADEEIGVIANYMQGTATIFRATDGSVLAQEVECFDGANPDDSPAGGPWARSCRVVHVPGVGKRAFVTLTNSTPVQADGQTMAGVAVIDLDDSSYPRTNFRHPDFGFIDGIAATPDGRRILLVDGGGKLHVVKVDVAPFELERTIDLPSGGSQQYFGGIAVRPSGDLAFIATGAKDLLSSPQGTMLIHVNYMTGTVLEIPNGLAAQTWGLAIESFGDPLKPHIFVHSLSGVLTIIPC